MKNVLVDSGFWFAHLGTRKDDLQPIANKIYERLVKLECNIIIPFPSLYETINTKLLKDKNKDAADWFLQQLNQNPKFIKVYDDAYRDQAFDSTTSNRSRGISLVDNILRVMMSDHNLKIDTLITFNTGDFVDVCTKCRIECVDQYNDLSEWR